MQRCACAGGTGTPDKTATGSTHPGLTIGRVDDPLEHNADRVANHIMRRPSSAPPIRGQAVADHDPHREPAVPAETGRYLDRSQGTGSPLSDGTRRYFETRFAADFRAVRVHDDDAAGQASRSIGALAFTRGSDIVFGAGQYAPGTAAGRHLLAHELTHVVQQAGNAELNRHELSVGPADNATEREADRVADQVIAGGVAQPTRAPHPVGVARKTDAGGPELSPTGAIVSELEPTSAIPGMKEGDYGWILRVYGLPCSCGNLQSEQFVMGTYSVHDDKGQIATVSACDEIRGSINRKSRMFHEWCDDLLEGFARGPQPVKPKYEKKSKTAYCGEPGEYVFADAPGVNLSFGDELPAGYEADGSGKPMGRFMRIGYQLSFQHKIWCGSTNPRLLTVRYISLAGERSRTEDTVILGEYPLS
jgi:hypothetical protein